MRSDEAHNGQLCNWWPAYDARAGYAEFSGGAALIQSAQKNDAGRKGAHKRFGKAVDPSLDFVDQMAQFHAHRFSPGYALAGGAYLRPSRLMCQRSSSGCNPGMLRRSPPDAMWS